MTPRLCYISRCYRDKDSAGNKAKTDYEQILFDMGAINLGLAQRISSGKIATFFLNLAGVVKFAFAVRRNDVVILQYPIKILLAYMLGSTDTGSQNRGICARPRLLSPA